MTQGSRRRTQLHFDGFALNVESMELLDQAGTPVVIPPRAFSLLVYLIENHDRVVSKAELFRELWGGVAVSEGSISQAVWAARRAVSDTGGRQRVIKNIPKYGYRFVAALDEDEGSHGTLRSERDAEGASEICPALVGRADYLTRLAHALDGASAGRARLTLLSGDMGIGKSALLRSLADRAQRAGSIVCNVCCRQAEGVAPFGPWQDAAREVIRQLRPEVLETRLAGTASELSRLIPEIRECVPSIGSRAIQNVGEERFYLLQALTDLFLLAAEDRPLLICVDDLHAADPSSVRALEQIARSLFRTRVLLCCAYRASEAPLVLYEVLQALELDRYTTIEVCELPHEAVEELLALHAPKNTPTDVLARVAELGCGNPFFLTQLARCIRPDSRGDSIAFPLEVRDAVRGQVRDLREGSVGVVRMAAVLGQRIRLGDLRRATQLPPDKLLEHLDHAADLRIVEDVPGELGVYRFAHPTIREIIHLDMPSTERARLHARVAESILEAHADDPDSRLDEIAHHYTEAAGGGYAREALDYSRRAAERAFKATAFESAITHYRRALQALDLHETVDFVPRAQTRSAPRSRLRLARSVSVQYRAGRATPRARFASSGRGSRVRRRSDSCRSADASAVRSTRPRRARRSPGAAR